jgi:AsmA protein
VSIQFKAGNNILDLEGGIATPITLAGTALNIQASIPDLSSLGPLAGASLPAWKNIMAQGTLIDPGGLGLLNAIGIDSAVLNMDNAALGGDFSWYFGIRPRLQVALKAQQINLDPLLAGLPDAHAPKAPATPPPERQTNYLIPPTKLPLAMLQAASADIQLSADSLIFHHATYTAIQGHAVLINGLLTFSPVTALVPGGSVAANATVNASKDPAAATLSVDAPALAISPFLSALGLPSAAEGTLQAGMSASGTGDSLQDLASSVQGQLGMAMVNGTVDGEVLSRVFGAALSAVDLPASLVGAQGPVAVRCFGLRLDAENGIGRISALTLDSNRLLVQGGGSLNFGNETLGLIIRPQLRVAGNQIGVPVKIGGTFADPTTSVAPLAAVQEAAKTAVGLTVSLAEEVPGAGSLLGKIENTIGPTSTADVCPAALSLARLGKPGPAAPLESTGGSRGSGGAPVTGPKSLLNALFGK